MITVEGKIRTFSKYVYDKEVKISNQTAQEVDEKNIEILQEKQKIIKEKCSILKGKINKKIIMESQSIISKAKLEAKDKILTVKKDLLLNLTQEILDSLHLYTENDEYGNYISLILDSTKDFLLTKDVKIYLIRKDVERFTNKIKKKYKDIEILEMSDESIGGMIIESLSTNERMDFTIRRKVDDWKNEIGLKLYEILEK